MTKETILKKAIEKAVKNGLNMDKIWTAQERDAFKKLGGMALINWQHREWGIIFSHDFAKAFWGDGRIGKKFKDLEIEGQKEFTPYFYDGFDHYNLPRWQYHLQQMVLEKDKIKYLERFL